MYAIIYKKVWLNIYKCITNIVKREEFMDYLRSNRIHVFNIHQAARIARQSEKYVSMRLATMQHIKRVKRGIYYIDDASIQEIASNILSPSYVSLLASFFLRGVTTQIPIEIQVIASVQHKGMEVEGYQIKFFKMEASRLFGFSRLDGAMVADLEKGITDSLYLNQYSDEVLDIMLESRDVIDANKLIEYAKRMRSKSTISRLGFIMERCGFRADELYSMRSERYVKLGPGGDMKNKKWKVLHAEQE